MSAHRVVRRLVPPFLLLFPALWGWLSLMNNVSGFAGTRDFAVGPMLAMTDTYGNPAQTWRAVTAPWAPGLALGLITAAETLAGLLSTLGIVALLRRLGAPAAAYDAAKTLGMLGCMAAIGVWGLGFMVIAGDWFLSWQGEDGIMGQLGGMVYTLPAMAALLALMRPEPD
jgi:predicted small integral membrane protein